MNWLKLAGAVAIFLAIFATALPVPLSIYILQAGLALTGAAHFYSGGGNSPAET